MAYPEQWKALSSCIRGLMQTGELHARYLSVRSDDSYGRAERLRDQVTLVLAAVETFRDLNWNTLSPEALAAILKFIEVTSPILKDAAGIPDIRQEQVWAALIMLAAFETEMLHCLSDLQHHIRARSERAFFHLKRLVVVDQAIRERWEAALTEGEVACEARRCPSLAPWHMGFQGRSRRGTNRPCFSGTNERHRYRRTLRRWFSVDGVESGHDRTAGPAAIYRTGTQAQRYSEGVLFSNELTKYRYVVVVSKRDVSIPTDRFEGSVIYRHINIAIHSRPPSRSRR